MCTLIALFKENEFILAVNRDDNFRRLHSRYASGELWYPIDPVSKGTWIGVSSAGDFAALLNGDSANSKKKSRGDIVPYILTEGIEMFEQKNLNGYAAFNLFLYEQAKHLAFLYSWDTSILRRNNLDKNFLENEPLVLTSSSYGESVAKKKKNRLKYNLNKEKNPSIQFLKEILQSHTPNKGIESVCMHGPKSQTLSSNIIHIQETKQTISLYGTKGSPCENKYQEFALW